MSRFIRWSMIGIVALLTVVLSGTWIMLWLSIPSDPPQLEASVGETVAVHYDRWRRLFVRAAVFDDALFAQGWLHARERLWQMELMRRAGKAQLAELSGRHSSRRMWNLSAPECPRLRYNSKPMLCRVCWNGLNVTWLASTRALNQPALHRRNSS